MTKRKKTEPDWAQIKADFVANTKSVRELARWHKISDTAIRKRAKGECWKRNERPSSHCELAPALSPAIVAAAADEHFALNLGVGLLTDLLVEIRYASIHRAEIERAIVDGTGDHPQRRQALLKTTTVATRVAATRNAVSALRTAMEAKAFPIKKTAVGKKILAHAEALSAGKGTEWGDDLDAPGTRVN